MRRHPKLFTFAKFIFSSLSSCVIDIFLFWAFCRLFVWLDVLRAGSLYVTVSTVGARVISATYNYLINYRVVFHSSSSRAASLTKYVTLAVVQMSLSAILVTAFHYAIGGREVLIKIPVDTALFFVSYFIQREIVYK